MSIREVEKFQINETYKIIADNIVETNDQLEEKCK